MLQSTRCPESTRCPASGRAKRARRQGLGSSLSGLPLALSLGILPSGMPVWAQATVTSTYRIPLQTFTYQPNSKSTYYKYGINLALGGSTSPAIFEFDTGGDGFFAAYSSGASWWGGNTGPTGISFSKSFDSGYTYTGLTVPTTVSFFGLPGSGSAPIFSSSSTFTVGQASSILNNGQTAWPSSTTSAPVESNFFGDFGLTLKQGDDGIENILAQLSYGGSAKAGYVVALGPYGSSSGAYLQLGLAESDLNNSATAWFDMQGKDQSKPFANSNLPSFSAELIKADLDLSLSGVPSASLRNRGINLDTGTPGLTIHYKKDDRSLLEPFSQTDGKDPLHLLPGVNVSLVASSSTLLQQQILSFVTGDNYGYDFVYTILRGDDKETYVNSGASLFQSYVVTYDLANQRVGLTPYPPAPAAPALAGALIGGGWGLRLRSLRRRIRAGRQARA